MGLLIAETKVTKLAAGERAGAIQAVVAQVIPMAGSVMLGLYVLVLSSALLPPLNVLIVLLFLVGFIAWLLRRSFIKVYSKAQNALEETFAQPRAVHPQPATGALPPLLREANLETVHLPANSTAVGKLIRELGLRSRTGASIVGIERNGDSLINPGPDEELQPGDQILLLGTAAKLAAARAELTRPSGPAT